MVHKDGSVISSEVGLSFQMVGTDDSVFITESSVPTIWNLRTKEIMRYLLH